MLGQYSFRNNFTGMQHQVLEHLVLESGQIQFTLVNISTLGGRIKADRRTDNTRIRPSGSTADQYTNARHHFLVVKRLDQVIIGTRIQPLDLVLPTSTGGEDQNGNIIALITDFIDYLQARHFR